MIMMEMLEEVEVMMEFLEEVEVQLDMLAQLHQLIKNNCLEIFQMSMKNETKVY